VGGTELMVAHAAGRLGARKLASLWGIPDLCFIETSKDHIVTGAGTTFGEIRTHEAVSAKFPLLAKAASWIGSIANQSRATLGGNLVNGSPAADSSPVLLVYDAEVELASVRKHRRIPYAEFHTGYKLNAMAPDELLFTVHLPLRFAHHRQYLRKVGTRRHGHRKGCVGGNGAGRGRASERDSIGSGKSCSPSHAALSDRICCGWPTH